jgi:hypothetical protein
MSREVPFCLENLRLLDFGLVAEAFLHEQSRVVGDCEDRPGDSKARVVQIKFLYAPKSDTPGRAECDQIEVQVEITSSLPKRVSKVYACQMRQQLDENGKPTVGLRFHPDANDDSQARLLFDEQARKEDQARGEGE